MKFSVIVPLEFHWGQAERCVKAWCREQTFPAETYEVLCVAPPSFRDAERAALEALLRPHDRLIRSESAHDMGLCAEAAASAKGDYLIFTESHAWPDPSTLEAGAAALQDHPEWAAFSGRTTRVPGNWLSNVAADMYEADFAYGMKAHPWRMVLDQCFVTRRKAYLAAGGFDARLGHFAEWVLAARYHELGLAIGYAPDVHLRHFYVGDVAELRQFTNDFIDGEIRYLSGRSPGVERMIEEPLEWSTRNNWSRPHARHVVRCLLGYL